MNIDRPEYNTTETTKIKGISSNQTKTGKVMKDCVN